MPTEEDMKTFVEGNRHAVDDHSYGIPIHQGAVICTVMMLSNVGSIQQKVVTKTMDIKKSTKENGKQHKYKLMINST